MKTVALAGGVGGSRLLSGLARILPPNDLTILVNTGDDFDWMGLYVCPDLDTVIYTLAGIENPDTGWGIAGDTFHALERLNQLGIDPWFRIGDRDLATHLYRTRSLREGCSLSDVIRSLCRQNRIEAHVLPMTDAPVPTRVQTAEGLLDFQEYFVARKCAPRVSGFAFQGIDRARPAPGVLESIAAAEAIVICPSNPFISIGPVLAVPGIRTALLECAAPVAAVSPIIEGRALKGPTARMFLQLGIQPSAHAVAELYRDLLDVFVLDEKDDDQSEAVASLGIEAVQAPTQMDSAESRIALARIVLKAVERIGR